MAEAYDDRRLRVCAVLFGLLGVSNLLKPLRLGGEQTGFVFFGHRLAGTANAIAGPLFGIYLLVYAAGIWRGRAYAFAMGCLYAAYVIVNLVMFQAVAPKPPGAGFVVFGVVYAVIAIGVSSGAAYLLGRRRAVAA